MTACRMGDTVYATSSEVRAGSRRATNPLISSSANMHTKEAVMRFSGTSRLPATPQEAEESQQAHNNVKLGPLVKHRPEREWVRG